MGGDNSPDKTIEGVSIFVNKNKNKDDFIINIFGKKNEIIEKLDKYKCNSNFINVIHTDSVISNEESPLTAIKNSKNTSMWNCIHHQCLEEI